MTIRTQEQRDYRFTMGLMTGTCVGAGLMLWFAPKAAAEIRRRMADSATSLGARTSDQYQQASTRVGMVVGELTRKGLEVRDEVAESVVRGAHEVARGAHAIERLAVSVAGDRR